MAENTDQGEKTEEPTQQRREDFRKRGQVAQTKELATVLLLIAAGLLVWMLGRYFFEQIYEVFVQAFGGQLYISGREGDYLGAFKFAIEKTFMIVGPVLGIAWVMSFASSALQVGFLFNEEAMQFKPERIDPVQGFKRIFSLRSLFEGFKAVFKVTIVASIAALVIQSELVTVPQLVTYSVGQIMEYVGDVTLKLLAGVGAFMAVLAGLDFMFQKWELEKKMRMSRHEVKEELKSREGDPLIKARIRRVQREMASKRMMEDVPKSDVVITNPTHIAVALKYTDQMVAPTIVAKGAGLIAEKIKKVAKENGVPVVENKPLARTIFKTLEIGMAIPKELYTAVAEVLSYVYRLKKKMRKR